MSINLTFSHAFYNIYNITLICRKYSKFIKEFVEFINDLSLIQYVLHRFLTGMRRIQLKKNCFFLKRSQTPSCSLCKLYHETDRQLFDEYKYKKPLWNHLRATTILKVLRETSFGRFSKKTLTHSQKRPAVVDVIHKNLTLIILFTYKESLLTGKLLKHT